MDKPNLEYITQLADGDTEFEKQFISILQEEFPKEKSVYVKAIEEKDWHEAAQIVHKLKHKFNILSMHEGYKLAVAFEEELNAKNDKSNAAFIGVLETVDAYLKTL